MQNSEEVSGARKIVGCAQEVHRLRTDVSRSSTPGLDRDAPAGGAIDCFAMRTHHSECPATTGRTLDFVDITADVEEALYSSGIKDGHVTVFAREHCCSLIINEHEHGLWRDLRATLERLEKDRPDELRASLGSASVVLPAVGGHLHLGMWQRLLLVELDGTPNEKHRSVHVQIVGE